MSLDEKILKRLADEILTFIEQREAEQVAYGIYDVTMTGAEVIDSFKPSEDIQLDAPEEAIAEIDSQIRQAQSEATFFQDLKRALFNLDRELLEQIVEYQQQKRAEAQELGIEIVLEEASTKETPDLSSLNLALVGGHEAVRREVIRELQENYQLKYFAEVAPSNEAYINRNNVQTKINNCDLVAMITGYMGHDLSKIVFELNKDGALVGEVLPLSCRGKSGVVREILTWWKKQRKVVSK